MDQDPFSAGVFSTIWWGSKLLDDSGRNGVTWDAGGLVSLTAATHITITGRLYLDIWSDRHCPTKSVNPTPMNNGFDGTPISVCKDFKLDTLSNDEKQRVTKLTGWKNPDDVFGRETGIRFMASLIAEVALQQQVSLYGILEGAPFQGERALFTNDFAHSMFTTDYNLYARIGLTYKF